MSISISDIGKRVYDLSNPREKRRYIVFLLRAALHRSELKQLVRFFIDDPLRQEIFKRQAFPIEQVTRAFFYNQSTFAERIKLVREHYEIIQGKLIDSEFVNWGDTDYTGFVVYDTVFEEHKFIVYSKFGIGQRKEGLQTIIMKLDDDVLYQVMFWCAKDKYGNDAIWIGALQGPNMDDAKNIVKKMTKWCHGYRTKNLALYILQAMARVMNISKIYAVSNYGYYANNHVRVDRKLKTNFGDFWLEAGGHETDDKRFFEVPIIETRKTMEEVPTRKRAVYRRRFAFLDEVDATIAGRMAQILK